MIEKQHDLKTEAGHLMVCYAIDRNDWISEAIFDLAADGRQSWTLPDWEEVISNLEACRFKIRDWMILYT